MPTEDPVIYNRTFVSADSMHIVNFQARTDVFVGVGIKMGYKFIRGSLRPVMIYQRKDRSFYAYATEWERVRCRAAQWFDYGSYLGKPGYSDPILHPQTNLVIGHVGSYSGRSIIRNDDGTRHLATKLGSRDLGRHELSEHDYVVVTDVNGKVLYYNFIGFQGGVESWPTLKQVLTIVDYVSIGMLALSVAGLGFRLMLSLIIRAGVTEVFAGAVARAAALEAEMAAMSEGAILQSGARGGFPLLPALPELSNDARIAAGKLLGQELSPALRVAWAECGNAQATRELAEVSRLLATGQAADREAAYRLSEALYSNWRNRFWTKVRATPALKAEFEMAGARFGPKGAPYFDLGAGKSKDLTVSLDHFVERRVDNPARAVDALNVRPVLAFENSATLEAIRKDNFLKGWVTSLLGAP